MKLRTDETIGRLGGDRKKLSIIACVYKLARRSDVAAVVVTHDLHFNAFGLSRERLRNASLESCDRIFRPCFQLLGIYGRNYPAVILALKDLMNGDPSYLQILYKHNTPPSAQAYLDG